MESGVDGNIVAASAAMAGETPAPTGASVYFINIKDGDVLTNPVTIQFGLKGMGVAPAGTEKKNTEVAGGGGL